MTLASRSRNGLASTADPSGPPVCRRSRSARKLSKQMMAAGIVPSTAIVADVCDRPGHTLNSPLPAWRMTRMSLRMVPMARKGRIRDSAVDIRAQAAYGLVEAARYLKLSPALPSSPRCIARRLLNETFPTQSDVWNSGIRNSVLQFRDPDRADHGAAAGHVDQRQRM
jgi:hypothetical protein